MWHSKSTVSPTFKNWHFTRSALLTIMSGPLPLSRNPESLSRNHFFTTVCKNSPLSWFWSLCLGIRQCRSLDGQYTILSDASIPTTQLRVLFTHLHIHDNVLQCYLRVMIAFILWGFLAILNGLFRASLDTRQALLAAMQPGWLFCCHDNVADRAGFFTNAAAIAFFIHPKIPIHLRDHVKCQFIRHSIFSATDLSRA